MEISMPERYAVLFVCLGNICRSPLAEAAFRAEAAKRGLEVGIDSAGIGDWHRGEPPDPRARATAKRHGIDIDDYAARQVCAADFVDFTHIVALDREVLVDLKRQRPEGSSAKIGLLLDHVKGREGKSVPDPYYGDERGFEYTWLDACAGACGLADELERG
jgi:protein-tyrosine phosphatase